MTRYLLVAYSVRWSDLGSRKCIPLGQLQGIPETAVRQKLCQRASGWMASAMWFIYAHTTEAVSWNSQRWTYIFMLYEVTSTVLSSGRLWLNLYFTNPFLIADAMIRQKGLDFERLITSVFILFLFYLKQQKTKVSIARLFICSAVLLPRCDHWKQTAVTWSWWSSAAEDPIFQQCQLCPSLLHGTVLAFWSFDIWSCCLLNIVLAPLSTCLGD